MQVTYYYLHTPTIHDTYMDSEVAGHPVILCGHLPGHHEGVLRGLCPLQLSLLPLQLPHLRVRPGGGAELKAGCGAANPVVLSSCLAQGSAVHAMVQGWSDAVHCGASARHSRCLVSSYQCYLRVEVLLMYM